MIRQEIDVLSDDVWIGVICGFAANRRVRTNNAKTWRDLASYFELKPFYLLLYTKETPDARRSPENGRSNSTNRR
ncbi:MAG: hypothetical protein AAF541_20540 [Pseudomonadota bacterium]